MSADNKLYERVHADTKGIALCASVLEKECKNLSNQITSVEQSDAARYLAKQAACLQCHVGSLQDLLGPAVRTNEQAFKDAETIRVLKKEVKRLEELLCIKRARGPDDAEPQAKRQRRDLAIVDPRPDKPKRQNKFPLYAFALSALAPDGRAKLKNLARKAQQEPVYGKKIVPHPDNEHEFICQLTAVQWLSEQTGHTGSAQMYDFFRKIKSNESTQAAVHEFNMRSLAPEELVRCTDMLSSQVHCEPIPDCDPIICVC